MSNKKAITRLVSAARIANHMAMHYRSMGMHVKALMWKHSRDVELATAKALKEDSQQ